MLRQFSTRFTKFIASVRLVLSDPIATVCCVNFSARFTKFIAIVSLVLMSGSCHLDSASNDQFSVECLF